MHREINQRVGEPAFAAAVVTGACTTSEWLERCAQSCTANRIENSADKKGAVLPSAHKQPSILDELRLLSHKSLGVGGMAGMTADVMELADGVLASLVQQRTLIEGGGCIGSR